MKELEEKRVAIYNAKPMNEIAYTCFENRCIANGSKSITHYCGSGSAMKRCPELERLIQDGKDGKYDIVVVKSICRLARDTEIVLKVIRQLNSLGIPIMAESENVIFGNGSEKGSVLFQIMTAMDAQEKAKQ